MEKRTLRGVETIRRFGDDPRKTRARRLAERESYGLSNLQGSCQFIQDKRLFLVRIHFHEAVLCAELDAGRICLLAVLLHGPAIKKFCANIE